MENTLENKGKNVRWENGVLFDWVSITSKQHSDLDFRSLLGLENVNFESSTGVSGYQSKDWFGGVNIHHGGRPETWLEMSGSGCRSFETHGTGDYDSLFDLCVRHADDVHLTRLDVAFDDFTGLLDIDQMKKDLRARNVNTKAKKVFLEESLDLIDDRKHGLTLQIGSPASEFLVRIYDKKAERLDKLEAENDIQELLKNINHWVRVELQLRNDRALQFVRILLGAEKMFIDGREVERPSIGTLFFCVLHNYLDFVVPSKTDTNRARWPLRPYWRRFLGDVVKVSVYRKPGTEYNLQRLDMFVHGHIGNAVYTSLQIHGVEDFIAQLDDLRPDKMNPKYKEILDNQRLYQSMTEDEKEQYHIREEIRRDYKRLAATVTKERDLYYDVPFERLPETLKRKIRLLSEFDSTFGKDPGDPEYLSDVDLARKYDDFKNWYSELMDQERRSAEFDRTKGALTHQQIMADIDALELCRSEADFNMTVGREPVDHTGRRWKICSCCRNLVPESLIINLGEQDPVCNNCAEVKK